MGVEGKARRRPRLTSGQSYVELDSGTRAHADARKLRERLIEHDLRAKRRSLLNTLFDGRVRVTKRGES